MKMALVDPRLLEALRPQPPTYMVGNIIRSLNDEIKAIITRMDLQDREKVTLYNQLLSRFYDMNDIHAQQPTRVTVVNDGATQKETEAAGSAAVDHVQADTKSLRKKVKRLVDLNNPFCQPEQIARDILHIARLLILDDGVIKVAICQLCHRFPPHISDHAVEVLIYTPSLFYFSKHIRGSIH